jgi:topoisomerase-4 subunit A
MSFVEPVMRRNFLEYASYVIVDRAIPDLRDGCKPVQRRILHTLRAMDDGRFHKVANVIGETMKLHPHGDASIGDALVVVANKEYFIERQGNFGNLLTGHAAAASRYIECRLTPLARETLFNEDLTTWQDSYDGRRKEPVFLPAKIPVILMLGTEGIAVGMSTRILPHNFGELLRAQIAILRGEPIELVPDFPQGGLMDVGEYRDGEGRIRVRARVRATRDRKQVVIEEVPFGTTTESLIASIEAAAQKGKLKIAGIEDRTAEKVEIVLHLRRGVYSDEVIPQLFAHTSCEMALTASSVVIEERRPVEMQPSVMLATLTARLKQQIKAELELELERLEARRHFLTLERIFIEQRVYKRIETARTEKAVREEVRSGMLEHVDELVRPLEDEDIARLLEIRIRRISAFDIAKNRKELGDVAKKLEECRRKLRALTETTIGYLEDLLERFGPNYPRRTEITSFEAVNKREVSIQNLRVAYDPETGFFGTEVKGDAYRLSVSEFDKLLVVSSDGTYRIIAPPQRTLLPQKVLHIGVFDEEQGQVLTLVYRDADRNAFAKKVHIRSFIREKEYRLVKGKGRIDRLWLGEPAETLHLAFVPAKRQRVTDTTFDLSQLGFCGVAARGTRMAPKPVARIRTWRG